MLGCLVQTVTQVCIEVPQMRASQLDLSTNQQSWYDIDIFGILTM